MHKIQFVPPSKHHVLVYCSKDFMKRKYDSEPLIIWLKFRLNINNRLRPEEIVLFYGEHIF